MNVKRFVGRSVREAMGLVRAAWGEEAVVLSNRSIPGGVEIVAMPGAQALPLGAGRAKAAPAAGQEAAAAPALAAPEGPAVPEEPMSTVSFERFVRERQLREQRQPQADLGAVAGVA